MTIRSMKPKYWRGKSEAQIENSITDLTGYGCIMTGDQLLIGPINDYANPRFLIKDVKRLELIGRTHIVGMKEGVFVEVRLNPATMDVIKGIKEE